MHLQRILLFMQMRLFARWKPAGLRHFFLSPLVYNSQERIGATYEYAPTSWEEQRELMEDVGRRGFIHTSGPKLVEERAHFHPMGPSWKETKKSSFFSVFVFSEPGKGTFLHYYPSYLRIDLILAS